MWFFLLGIAALVSLGNACTPSATTASGTYAPREICSGDLIFSDEFDYFNLEKWQHEITLSGGGVSILTYMYDSIIEKIALQFSYYYSKAKRFF